MAGLSERFTARGCRGDSVEGDMLLGYTINTAQVVLWEKSNKTKRQ